MVVGGLLVEVVVGGGSGWGLHWIGFGWWWCWGISVMLLTGHGGPVVAPVILNEGFLPRRDQTGIFRSFTVRPVMRASVGGTNIIPTGRLNHSFHLKRA